MDIFICPLQIIVNFLDAYMHTHSLQMMTYPLRVDVYDFYGEGINKTIKKITLLIILILQKN